MYYMIRFRERNGLIHSMISTTASTKRGPWDRTLCNLKLDGMERFAEFNVGDERGAVALDRGCDECIRLTEVVLDLLE